MDGDLPTGDFHPISSAHAGRTQGTPADCLRQPLSLGVIRQRESKE